MEALTATVIREGRPPEVTADLEASSEHDPPFCGCSAAQLWRDRDEGRLTVIQWHRGGRHVGTHAISQDDTPAGRVLVSQAARVHEPDVSGQAWELVRKIAERAGCIGIRAVSSRPLDRLGLGLRPVGTIYAMEVSDG